VQKLYKELALLVASHSTSDCNYSIIRSNSIKMDNKIYIYKELALLVASHSTSDCNYSIIRSNSIKMDTKIYIRFLVP
jgi:hypothetical protein